MGIRASGFYILTDREKKFFSCELRRGAVLLPRVNRRGFLSKEGSNRGGNEEKGNGFPTILHRPGICRPVHRLVGSHRPQSDCLEAVLLLGIAEEAKPGHNMLWSVNRKPLLGGPRGLRRRRPNSNYHHVAGPQSI